MALESTPAFGSDRTSGPLRWLVQLVFGQLNDPTWEIVHHLIRKTGHFVGYGVLGWVWLRAWRMTFPGARFLSHAGLALLGTALVASWDEWHQYLPAQPHRLSMGCAAGLLRRRRHDRNDWTVPALVPARARGPTGLSYITKTVVLDNAVHASTRGSDFHSSIGSDFH